MVKECIVEGIISSGYGIIPTKREGSQNQNFRKFPMFSEFWLYKS